ncbi:rhomboid-like protein [Yinghuangia seranimata]|uniref:rhomboid-like protein n=1 Tax=Yinghuangia seranimata TaxID=408067 RepID=UPI00248BE2C6|nr:rhomboid-like protein [Yinghuangia seranimata]MDI2128047.1 hypothetical protein [Yinghuangia seranimata]
MTTVTGTDTRPAHPPAHTRTAALAATTAAATTALRRAAAVLPHPRRTPVTFWYLAVLLVTTQLRRMLPEDTVERLVSGSSTDAYHLTHSPLRVLIASALWTAGGLWTLYAVQFSLILAPLERRVGGRRLLMVFASGHIAATLATELPIAAMVGFNHLPDDSAHRVDVGVSFGLYATAGALMGLLTLRHRLLGLALIAATLIPDVLELDDPVAAFGHPFALAVGILWWPVLTRTRVTQV